MIFQSTWQTNTASNLVELRKKIISENYSVDSFDSSKNLFPDTSIPSGVSIITGPQAKSVKHPVLDGYYISDEKSFSILKKITHRGKFNFHSENKYMVIVGESNGASLLNNRIISKPVIVTDITKSPYANPQILYSSDTRNDCVNAQRFWSTKFVRFAIKQLKRGHHQPIKVFGFVPDVDQTKFTTDKELNDKFNLTQEEIKYIDENISHF